MCGCVVVRVCVGGGIRVLVSKCAVACVGP